MHKQIISSILIFSMLFLCSCSIWGARTDMLNEENDDNKADARLEQVIKTIQDKDKNALSALFSKKATTEANNFDGTMDDLFVFIQGKIETWERLDGPTVFDTNNNGHVIKEVSSYYYINTDKQKYFVLLRDYPVDTDHPDNVGLYMLLAVKAEDESKIYDDTQKILYDGNKKLSHAGIYLPIS